MEYLREKLKFNIDDVVNIKPGRGLTDSIEKNPWIIVSIEIIVKKNVEIKPKYFVRSATKPVGAVYSEEDLELVEREINFCDNCF